MVQIFFKRKMIFFFLNKSVVSSQYLIICQSRIHEMMYQQTKLQPVIHVMKDSVFKFSFFQVFWYLFLIKYIICIILFQLCRMEVIFHCKGNKIVIEAPKKLIIKIEIFAPSTNRSLAQRALLSFAYTVVERVCLLLWHWETVAALRDRPGQKYHTKEGEVGASRWR